MRDYAGRIGEGQEKNRSAGRVVAIAGPQSRMGDAPAQFRRLGRLRDLAEHPGTTSPTGTGACGADLHVAAQTEHDRQVAAGFQKPHAIAGEAVLGEVEESESGQQTGQGIAEHDHAGIGDLVPPEFQHTQFAQVCRRATPRGRHRPDRCRSGRAGRTSRVPDWRRVQRLQLNQSAHWRARADRAGPIAPASAPERGVGQRGSAPIADRIAVQMKRVQAPNDGLPSAPAPPASPMSLPDTSSTVRPAKNGDCRECRQPIGRERPVIVERKRRQGRKCARPRK